MVICLGLSTRCPHTAYFTLRTFTNASDHFRKFSSSTWAQVTCTYCTHALSLCHCMTLNGTALDQADLPWSWPYTRTPPSARCFASLLYLPMCSPTPWQMKSNTLWKKSATCQNVFNNCVVSGVCFAINSIFNCMHHNIPDGELRLFMYFNSIDQTNAWKYVSGKLL